MKTTTFWILFIKIIGVFILVSGLNLMPSVITTIAFLSTSNQDSLQGIFLGVGLVLAMVGFYLFIIYSFIFRSEGVINKLKLNKGIDEDLIHLTISETSVLKIALLVIGGWVIIETLPELITQIFAYFKQRQFMGSYEQDIPFMKWFLIYVLKLILGYFFIVHNRSIVDAVVKYMHKSDSPV